MNKALCVCIYIYAYRFKCRSIFPLMNIWSVMFLTLGISVKYFSWTSAETFLMAVALTDWNSLGICVFHKKYFTREILLAQKSPFSTASHLHLHFTQVPRIGLCSNSCSLRHYCCMFCFPFFSRGWEGNWTTRWCEHAELMLWSKKATSKQPAPPSVRNLICNTKRHKKVLL